MYREVPYYRGGGDEEKAERIIQSAFGPNILYSLIVGSTLILVSVYLKKTGWEKNYVDLIFFLGILIITNKIKNFYSYKLAADKNIFLLSKGEILYGFMSAVGVISIIYFIGFRGLFIGLLIADTIYIGYILLKSERRFPTIKISFSLFWELLKIGFPMMIVGFLLMLLTSADRLIIITMLSEEYLGYFGIATVAVGIVSTIPNALENIIVPRLMEKLGKTQDSYQIKNYLIEPAVLIAYFMPFLIALFYLSIHLPIEYFLTKYFPAIAVVKILILGLFFYAVASIPLNVSFALNRQNNIIYIALPAVMLNIILNYSFVRFGWGINGIAIGTGISYFVFSNMMLWFASKLFKIRIKEYLRFVLLIYAPFLYLVFLLFLIDLFLPLNSSDFWNDVIFTSIQIAAFILLYSIILIFVRKHSALKKLIANLPMRHLWQN
jgi:O-antigen/teichoic acid export membrane protein